MKRKILCTLLALVCLICCLCGAAHAAAPEKIKVLILPKFEVDAMAGDFPGEAQHYYEAYCQGAAEYEIRGGCAGNLLYVKDGVALYVTGIDAACSGKL